MHKEIYINLPVRDLAASQAFFSALGYSFNREYTDENAACLILGENIFAMLLRPEFFQKFAPASINPSGNEVLIALNFPDRASVDEHIKKALAAGASCFAEPMDHGFMYQHSFKDLDGHVWEFLSMEAAA
ncbi:MAG: glyoxalase/bleomycin resistance/extradiol dioxygenase family protein [Moraxellaceae bacterium]|nr:MAG: glyoxalase/bleomycin resistance/extradiol dioxygenase family protein [Moraxellaceae bacterium]